MSDGSTGLTGRQPQAIRTALAVLRAVAQAGPGITARQISAELDLPPATTYRVLNLLVGEEYLVRLPDLRGFALGARLAELVGMSVEQSCGGTDGGVTPGVADPRASTRLAAATATREIPCDQDVETAAMAANRTS
ncbi:MAG: IclR family transcriptional regulator [Pseudonocardiales bacterium]|nr:IclR family transcriptional regulator [Pseudonocardiales bacterium]